MAQTDSYRNSGSSAGNYFRLQTPASAAMRTLQISKVVVTAPTSLKPTPQSTSKDSFVLSLQRSGHAARELWLGGQAVPVVPHPQGTLSLLNLVLDPTAYLGGSHDCVSFYLERAAFDKLADDSGAQRIDALDIRPGVAVDDSVVSNLGACLLWAIEQSQRVSAHFIDHIAWALHAHLAEQYGGMRIPRSQSTGGLAPWQLRLARTRMAESLDGRTSLAQIASDCGLSVNHFARAFSQSTGVPPHRWMTLRRVDSAKELIRTTALPMAEISVACGFADQSHLTRVFSAATGVTPSRWRDTQLARSHDPEVLLKRRKAR